MSSFLIRNQIDHAEGLLDFSEAGYRFSTKDSTETSPYSSVPKRTGRLPDPTPALNGIRQAYPRSFFCFFCLFVPECRLFEKQNLF